MLLTLINFYLAAVGIRLRRQSWQSWHNSSSRIFKSWQISSLRLRQQTLDKLRSLDATQIPLSMQFLSGVGLNHYLALSANNPLTQCYLLDLIDMTQADEDAYSLPADDLNTLMLVNLSFLVAKLKFVPYFEVELRLSL